MEWVNWIDNSHVAWFGDVGATNNVDCLWSEDITQINGTKTELGPCTSMTSTRKADNRFPPLVDSQGRVVDVLVYGNGVYAGAVPFGDLERVYNGNSLERWPANRDSDDCGRDFRVRYSPAPGVVKHW